MIERTTKLRIPLYSYAVRLILDGTNLLKLYA